MQQQPVVLCAGLGCAHCRVSTVHAKPRKAMGKVSVKTLRGALHPTALHWSSFPDQKTTAPVLCSLSFKEHEVSVDRGRFGNIGKNETFHKQKLGGSEENNFFTVKTTAEKLNH